MSVSLSFSMPLVPPSVNHYVKHFRNGGHAVTGEAAAFKAAVAAFAAGGTVEGVRFRVTIIITVPVKGRGDVDNFPKLVLDGLADAGVFRNKKGKRLTDSTVESLHVTLDRDARPLTGRTFIGVSALR